jgi:hypothetical protein
LIIAPALIAPALIEAGFRGAARRLDRLFGATMPERGISQIVSVESATAESFLEAG